MVLLSDRCRKNPTAAALLHGRHVNGTLNTVSAIDDVVKEALKPQVRFYRWPRVDLELPLEGSPGWRLGLLVLVHEGSLVIAEVKVFPDGDRRDPALVNRHEWVTQLRQWSEDASALEGVDVPTITTRMLRSIRLGEIVPTIRDALERQQLEPFERNLWEDVLGPLPSTLGEVFAEVLSHAPAHPRRGDVYLAELARRYAERVAAGSKSPVKDLAVGVSTAHIRDAIFRAREKGYLTRSYGPRPGGVLTQAGREVLDRAAPAAQKASSPKVVRRRGATAPSPFTQSEGSTK